MVRQISIALRRRLEREDDAAIEMGEPLDWIEEESKWTADTVMDLIKNIGSRQKDFLQLLFERFAVTSDQAIEALGLESEVAFAGVLSGLSKQLKKLNLSPWNLYDVHVQWKGKEKQRSFQLASTFRFAALELGWPDWDRPKKLSAGRISSR